MALDGVYTETETDETPLFHPLPHLTSQDVADLLQVARVRILRSLKRQGAVVETSPLEVSDASAAVAEEGLQQLAAAAVTGQVPAGPELREREPWCSQLCHNLSARHSPNGRAPHAASPWRAGTWGQRHRRRQPTAAATPT